MVLVSRLSILPLPLTMRKIFFLLSFLFIILFNIPYWTMVVLGALALFLVVILSFLGPFEILDKYNKVVVYAWGFFMVAVLLKGWEFFKKEYEKNKK